jgi:hypothetical protein
MKKIYISILVLFFVFSGQSLAQAKETISLPNFALFTFESTIKLKSKGCQDLLIEYITEESLSRENTGMAVVIDNKLPNDGIVYGAAGWFSKLTYPNAPNIGFQWPRVGVLRIKVCQNNWSTGSGNSRTLNLKVKPGSYKIFFRGNYVDKDTGKFGEVMQVESKITFVSNANK